MKTRLKSGQGRRRLQLRIFPYGNSYYIEWIAKLESTLNKKPRLLHIEMIGEGEIPADLALLIRSVLMGRARKTSVITDARSSLQGGSVLVWLLGDRRTIRDDARLYFRQMDLEEETEHAGVQSESAGKYKDSFSETEPEDIDYARVLQLINEFLPVAELAGRPIRVPVLRQFGLVGNETVDQFLSAAFGKSRAALVAR